jgi:para-aminobenzoate synthetase/4-amino-4-deoxychorismate lyase
VTDIRFLFEDLQAPPDARAAFVFECPVRRVQAKDVREVPAALAEVDAERGKGRYLCGYLAYEAGAAFIGTPASASTCCLLGPSALVDFVSFEERRALTRDEVDDWLSRDQRADRRATAIHDLEWTETRESYCAKLARIREHLTAGDTYQANFTMKLRFRFEGSALALYRTLRDRQRARFAAYVRLPEGEVLSLSPELFVRKEGPWLTCMPMKGTAPRGRDRDEDERLLRDLRSDPKTLSENVMIVDLMRSDVGRIAEVGSVQVSGLFEVQSLETVHQMTSTVRGKVGPEIALDGVLAALFPCGSVTGAPKRRTVEILAGLESEPRGIYTGALGWVAPDNDLCFSDPIRTIVAQGGRAEMGVGSGVVFESDAHREFDECLLKAAFVTGCNAGFRLFESMRLDPRDRRPARLGAHLNRMQASAAALHFVFDRGRAVDAIDRATGGLSEGPYKLRLMLAQDGAFDVVAEALTDVGALEPPWVAVSSRRVDSSSCFRRHKTTMRALYEEEYATWRARGAYDVLFLNERGDVAEATRHNVFIDRGGRLVTPPTHSGALAGIERARILREMSAVEANVSYEELRTAHRVLLTNAVRGTVSVKLGGP